MGYLAMMCGSFLVALVGIAVVLAVLSTTFIGTVGEWVLFAALFTAFVASVTATHWYEDTRRPWRSRP